MRFAVLAIAGLSMYASAEGATIKKAQYGKMPGGEAIYAFTLSKPLVAGKQLIKVENGAAQPHEVVLVQLAPGKTIEDVGKWVFDMKGPPPGKPIGGIPAFVKGKDSFFEADLTPGEYGMICFVPDAKDGKPHVQHGMTTQFKIG